MRNLSINVCSNVLLHNILLIGFSFLSSHYSLLYQALIPNCKLTINILKEHLEVSDSAREYVLEGDNPRMKCQRVLNLLIGHLDNERNYLQFCHLFSMISVMSDLPNKLIAGTLYIQYYLLATYVCVCVLSIHYYLCNMRCS